MGLCHFISLPGTMSPSQKKGAVKMLNQMKISGTWPVQNGIRYTVWVGYVESETCEGTDYAKDTLDCEQTKISRPVKSTNAHFGKMRQTDHNSRMAECHSSTVSFLRILFFNCLVNFYAYLAFICIVFNSEKIATFAWQPCINIQDGIFVISLIIITLHDLILFRKCFNQ